MGSVRVVTGSTGSLRILIQKRKKAGVVEQYHLHLKHLRSG